MATPHPNRTGLSAAAIASALSSDALWAIAFPLLGLSGPGVFMAVLSFGETYPLLEPIVRTYIYDILLCTHTYVCREIPIFKDT